MAKYTYPFAGSFPVTETFAQGDPGVDWGMPVGTPILAIADGTVTKVGMSGYGPFYVQLDHGKGVQSFYGHNSQSLVSVGQTVKQGQLIALSGNMGNSTGPHLELGILLNGVHVDPQAFLAKQGVGAPDPAKAAIGASGTVSPASGGSGGIVGSIVSGIFAPFIEFAIEAGMVAGGMGLILLGLIILGKQTSTGKALVSAGANVGIAAALA